MSAIPLNTLRNVVHSFADFLTVATHTILYERDIYPKTSFVSVRKYNLPVRQNRHPQVCEWVNDAVSAVQSQLLKGAVDRVAVVIYSKSNEALERFVFDCSDIPQLPEADLDVPMVREDMDEEVASLLPVVDMDEQFRAVMSKIANSPSTLRALPRNCTFTIAIELKSDDRHAPISHPQAWVPANPEERSPAASNEPAQHQLAKTTPLRTLRAGELKFEAWVEESAMKERLQAPQSNTSGSKPSKIPSAEG